MYSKVHIDDELPPSGVVDVPIRMESPNRESLLLAMNYRGIKHWLKKGSMETDKELSDAYHRGYIAGSKTIYKFIKRETIKAKYRNEYMKNEISPSLTINEQNSTLIMFERMWDFIVSKIPKHL